MPRLQTVANAINEKIRGFRAVLDADGLVVYDTNNDVIVSSEWHNTNAGLLEEIQCYFGPIWEAEENGNQAEVEKTRCLLEEMGYERIDDHDYLLQETDEIRHVLIRRDDVLLTIMNRDTEKMREVEVLHRYITRSKQFTEA